MAEVITLAAEDMVVAITLKDKEKPTTLVADTAAVTIPATEEVMTADTTQVDVTFSPWFISKISHNKL